MDTRFIGNGYTVSQDGNVFSHRLGRNLKRIINANGYATVSVSRDGLKRRVWKVSVLICEAFHGAKPFSKAMVRHLNDIRHDDRAENLSWGSKSDNSSDAVKNGKCSAATNAKKSSAKRAGEKNYLAKLTWDQALEIRQRRANGESGKSLASEFKVSPMCVSDIYLGKKWKEEQRHG